MHVAESQIRRSKPWADETRWTLGSLADQARDIAVETPSEFAPLQTKLEALADSLDVIAHERPAINRPRTDILAAVDDATNEAAAIRERWLPAHRYSQQSIENLRHKVRTVGAQAAQLTQRSEAMIAHHRLDELRSEASQIGLVLLQAATFGAGLDDEEAIHTLVGIARRLRELETRTIYSDGGASVGRIITDLDSASQALNAWVAEHLEKRRL